MSGGETAAVRNLCTTKSMTKKYPRGCMANTLTRNRVTTRTVLRCLGNGSSSQVTTRGGRRTLRHNKRRRLSRATVTGGTRCRSRLGTSHSLVGTRRLRRTVRGVVSRCTKKVDASCECDKVDLTGTSRRVTTLLPMISALTTASACRLVRVCRLHRQLVIYRTIVTRLTTEGRAE